MSHILLRLIDEAYDRRSWHGTNLRGSIRGLRARDVVWRPAPRRHNIWEIVVHAAYWKYAVRRRLLHEKRGSFPLDGSNWFVRSATGRDAEAKWRADLQLLRNQHLRLREAVEQFLREDGAMKATSRNRTTLWLITGIAAHDLYHAGQIQLLKRLGKR